MKVQKYKQPISEATSNLSLSTFQGRVLDTPEVAQAKAAHFAAYSQAASHAGYEAPEPVHHGPAPVSSYNHGNDAEDSGEYAGSYAAEDDYGSGSSEGYYEGQAASAPLYRGALAPLAHDGRVIDTPAVARAKAVHLAAVQKASYGQPRAQFYQHGPRSYYGDY